MTIPEVWLDDMRAGMKHDETIEVCFHRMMALKAALQRNGHPMTDRAVKLLLADGLPQEAKDGSIIGALAGRPLEEGLEVLETIAKGVKFYDTIPKAAPAMANTASATPASTPQ